MTAPVVFEWTGETMRPLKRFHNLANAQYVVGQTYVLVEQNERSITSHNHQFAWLDEAWKSLPESIADLFPTSEHLRKHALIEVGYFDETILDVGSRAGALRVAAQMRHDDEFAHIVVRGVLVVRRTAKSQKRIKMQPGAFQDSKQKILEYVSGLIGVSPDALHRNAGKAA